MVYPHEREADLRFPIILSHLGGSPVKIHDQVIELEREFRNYESAGMNDRSVLGYYLGECQCLMKLATEKRDDITEDVVPAYQRASQIEWNLKVKLGLV
jgi:hypothetical protein